MNLALEFGRNSQRLCNIFDCEKKEATRKIEERYQNIKRKQARLSQLDNELAIAKANLRSASSARNASAARDFEFNRYGLKIFFQAFRKMTI